MSKAVHALGSSSSVAESPTAGNDDILKQIFAAVHAKGGVDFTHYKQPGIRRRLARRMALSRISNLQDYLEHLRRQPDEVSALYQDLLITVTEFFRDTETFDFLKTAVLPKILEGLPNDTPARVWVVGCASGEEAYSIAICFAELAQDRMNVPVHIFATDVSDACIAAARGGIYSGDITAKVSPERLELFFTKENGMYRVRHRIRETCTFGKQDVISDPPFARMDLVSCRNLLMYLDKPTQSEVLRRFHYALKPTGFLMLGTAESTAVEPMLFEQVQNPYRIYSKLPVLSRVDFSTMRPHATFAKRRPVGVQDLYGGFYES